ncbi:MAG: hypothetical protein NTV98_05385 [Candidatus Roizmanbacteria bacterium]|nr:hypothetical protein [Candidatus Roizmanbacteria bacterium]
MASVKSTRPFTEAPSSGSVTEEYFFRMMSPGAARKSKSYEDEEQKSLQWLIDNTSDIFERNFIVIGAGTLWYVDLVFNKVKNYIAIEPLSKLYISRQLMFLIKKFKNIKIISKLFGDVSIDEIPNGKNIYVFMFNILAYIEGPITRINKLIKPNDIIYISSWNKTPEAKQVRKKYFDYLNSFENEIIIDPESTLGLCHLDNFPFDKLKYYKSHKRITDKITDILIIYT